MPSHKLVIIGLDAADFSLVQRLIAAGEMPRLSAIADRGCFSLLRSTIPAQTAPAWTSMTTGVNPGKHGIYYFHNFSTWPITITNGTNTSTPRIWDYVGALEERSVVVNVPVTYPAQNVLGSLVSGIPPWYLDERSVYPDALMAEIVGAGYEIDAPMSRGLEKRPDALVDRVIATEERRVKLFLDLLKKEDWSFGMVVLTGLDRLQHKLVGKGEREDQAVTDGYRKVDALVGRILDSLGGGVNYLVTSDHGYNARPVAFYPNAWLHSQGMLRRKSSLRYRLTGMAHDLFDGHLLWLPKSLTKRFQGAATVVHAIDAVDIERSRAFVPGTDGVMVVRSKEDEATIAAGLSGLKDESGKEVCKVYLREEVYKGDRVGAAPELLLIPRDDVNIKTDPFSRSFLSRSGSFPKGNHSPNGIFLAGGPDIKRAQGLDLSIEDVAPTSLTLMGIRPPDSMEGRSAKEIFVDAPQPQSLRPTSVTGGDRSYAFSEAEEKDVMENLKRLGYT